jgi:hypothetical protein
MPDGAVVIEIDETNVAGDADARGAIVVAASTSGNRLNTV